MKKVLPLLIVVSAVAFSACSPSRWFGGGENNPNISDYGAGIEIEELSKDGQDGLLKTPVADLETLNLEKAGDATAAAGGSGVVRYQYEGDTAQFLVTTDLDTEKAPYSVWVRSADMDNLTLAFKLQDGKGGAWGSASVPISRLPLEVLVAGTESRNQVLDQTILKVVIPRPANTEGQ